MSWELRLDANQEGRDIRGRFLKGNKLHFGSRSGFHHHSPAVQEKILAVLKRGRERAQCPEIKERRCEKQSRRIVQLDNLGRYRVASTRTIAKLLGLDTTKHLIQCCMYNKRGYRRVKTSSGSDFSYNGFRFYYYEDERWQTKIGKVFNPGKNFIRKGNFKKI